MSRRLCATLVALALGSAAPALAQNLELEPYIGVYVPFLDIVDQTANLPGLGDVELQGSQKEAVVVGGRLSLWLAGPLGIEGNFLYALSDGESTQDGTTMEEDGYVWVGDGRLILKLLPGPIGVHIDGGVALIGRGGDAYADVTEGETDLGGVLGAGLRVDLPGLFAIRGDLDAFAYEAELTQDFSGTEVPLDSQLQVDVVASAGLVIGLGR